jgi:hypothetical protein
VRYIILDSVVLGSDNHLFDARSVIICGAWALECEVEYENQAGNVLFIKEAPHEWLFSRCSVAVHHGGAGTTGGMSSDLMNPSGSDYCSF